MSNYRAPDKNRILAVFNGDVPDRVPNYEVLVQDPTFRHIMGRDVPGGHTLAGLDPQDYIEFATKIGQDVIGISLGGNPFRYVDDTGQEKSLDFPITSRSDLDRVFVAGLEELEPSFELLDRYAQAVEGTEVGLFVLFASFFTTTYTNIFGFENFMCMLYDGRDLIEEVLEEYAAYYAAVSERVVEYPLTFLYPADDLAYKSGTIIRPEMLREMWVPRMQRVFDPALAKSIPILFHSDGNIESLIPDLLDMGINALNPIEPYGMDIRTIKKRFGKNLALVGNMDVGGVLSTGTPEQVREEAKELIRDVGKDGGFVLASCHSITGNVRPENFLAMVDTAQTYGIY